ncbi:MAG: type II toxin-antitoxin system HipA family toxin [Acidiferrobacterales bacterium]
MIRLSVWLRLPDGSRLLAGALAVGDPDPRRGGALQGEFRYDPHYLAHPAAFPLDPIHLPLREDSFFTDRPKDGVHAVFEDSLPDAWGRGLLARRHRLPRAFQRTPEFLARIGAQALGALSYEALPPESRSRRPARKEPVVLGDARIPDLSELLDAARRHADGQDPSADDPEALLLFRAGSSPGGARPKVLILDQGIHFIAKFPHRQDEVDFVRVEAASLELARRCGLSVPEFRVMDCGDAAALLVRRFDVDDTSPDGRAHLVSLSTLLGAEGYYHFGYPDIADLLRRISDRPGDDLPALFGLAVFNAVLGNTDDHLKNFAMLHGRQGWRLSPAYDLMPDVAHRQEHVLHFGASRGCRPDRDALHDLARQAGLSAVSSSRILKRTAEVMKDWNSVFREHGVPERDLVRLRPSIEGRIARCLEASLEPEEARDVRPGR